MLTVRKIIRLAAMCGSRAALQLLVGLMVAGAVIGHPAKAAPPTCSTASSPGGRGITISKTCFAAAETDYRPTDAYYQLQTRVVAGQGFADNARFKSKSAEGKILSSFLKTFFGTTDVTKLLIGLRLKEGGFEYPLMPLMEFTIDDGRWTSSIKGDGLSLLHKLPAGGRFEASFTYAYSNKRSLDLGTAKDLIESTGITLVTPVAAPLFNFANAFGNALLSDGALDDNSSYDFTFSPEPNGRVEQQFKITDPRTNALIATVTIQMLGKRSYMSSAQPVGSIGGTLPNGLVDDGRLADIRDAVAVGQAKTQSILQNALGKTDVSELSIGTDLTPQSIAQICAKASERLRDDYRLSSFDNLIIRAKLINTVAASAKQPINPFALCFTQPAERQLIAKHLGYSTETVISESSPLRDYEVLEAIGCQLTGKAGDDCGPLDISRGKAVAASGAVITARPLEGLADNSPILEGMPPSRTLDAGAFFDRFGGRFARFHTIASSSGSLMVHERADGPALRLEVRVAPNGKINLISLYR